ncbi:hypothetical protein MSAN_01754500 [Mycena sanguinolenta]|uniref:Uncharacterized protein n=1 Tax=Mycena sanguinolenta TaxID=230812 RepID=A0A8H6XX45_9AGAR|nr:hypothetical protein MSAN_01754500 [Mycena sanguinolenta]
MSSHADPTLSAALSEIDALVDRFGYTLMHQVVLTVSESIFFSAYGIFFAVALYSIFRKGLKVRAATVMLVVVVLLYASSLTQWIINLWTALEGIYSLLMVPGVPIPDRPALFFEDFGKIAVPGEGLFVFNMILGDAVVVWRTWVVHCHRILAILLPCVLLLISFVFGLMDIVCNSNLGRATPLPGATTVCPQADLIGWAFSVATNVTCTILIGFQAWRHRKILRLLNAPGKSRRMSSEKVLSLLVESGAIYSLLWLTQVISYLDIPLTSPALFAWAVLKGMGNQLSGLYPTLIIVIVNFRRTIWEETPTGIGNALPWVPNSNPKLSGITDTFGSLRAGDVVHLQSVIDIGTEKAMKHAGLAQDYEV